MADTLRDLAYGAVLRGQMPPQPLRLPDTIQRLAMRQDAIGAPQRGTIAGLVGDAGSTVQRLAEALSNYSAPIPMTDNRRISLKDLTLGDAGQVIEDWSYGSPPTTGGNYATGGVGTLGAQPRAMDLFNLGGVAGGAAKAGRVGADVLGPTLREMARKGIEGNMRATGGMHDVIAWHGTTNTIPQAGALSGGDSAARQALSEMAQKYGIKEWGDVPSIFDRWVSMGMADQFGVTPEMAAQARDLYQRTKPTYTPGKEELGFDAFRMPADGKELGVHFGTKQQAEMFGTPFQFDVDITRPLRLPDLGTWKPEAVIEAASKAGVRFTPADRKAVLSASDQNDALRKLLNAKGYDGIVYKNEAEGAGDSFIAFSNKQIRKIDQK